MKIQLVAYAFKYDESIHAAVKRIVVEEIDAAVDQLEGRGTPDRDTAIHEARKNVKKIRGVLKLMRPELGSTYGIENQRFGEIGRKLSDFRDSGAMLETFDDLSRHYQSEWGRQHSMHSIRSRLEQAKASHDSESDIVSVLATVAQELHSAASDVKGWPLQADDFCAISPGLRLTYRAGRLAMASAVRDQNSVNFHTWRKRVKDHWYHVRLLEKRCGGTLCFYQKVLKDLEGYLGDDHNLVVLGEQIAVQPDFYGNPPDIEQFLFTVEDRHNSLRSSAMQLGQSVYEDRPKVCAANIQSLWKEWVKDRERTNLSLPATGLSGCET